MKIAFDGQFFLKGDKTGIAWSADNVLRYLGKKEDISKQVTCFGLGYSKTQKNQVFVYQNVGCSIKMCNWFHDVIYRKIWNYIPLPYSFFFGREADVSIFFNFIIPPGVRGKRIAVVHDMAYRTYAETVRKKTRRFLENSMVKSCRRADKIITISQFSKEEILRYISVEESKIEVVPWGVDCEKYHAGYSSVTIEQVKHHYSIFGDYILYLGTIEPRKNIERLIRAYALVNGQNNSIPPLVLAGKKGWYYDEIFLAVEELNLKNKVLFLGYVPEEDVPMLLCGAKMFVFPSLYEGFGLPPLEAMACGVPVITSNVASLPEIAEGAAMMVDPMNVESIANGMNIVMSDEKLRRRLVAAGLERASQYTWERAAERIESICRELTEK